MDFLFPTRKSFPDQSILVMILMKRLIRIFRILGLMFILSGPKDQEEYYLGHQMITGNLSGILSTKFFRVSQFPLMTAIGNYVYVVWAQGIGDTTN